MDKTAIHVANNTVEADVDLGDDVDVVVNEDRFLFFSLLMMVK